MRSDRPILSGWNLAPASSRLLFCHLARIPRLLALLPPPPPATKLPMPPLLLLLLPPPPAQPLPLLMAAPVPARLSPGPCCNRATARRGRQDPLQASTTRTPLTVFGVL